MSVAPSVHALRLNYTIPVAPGVTLDRFVSCFLIYGETITLIDTGVAGCSTDIFESIRASGRAPKEISRIILTHSHPDHMGGAWAIQRATGCTIAAHAAELEWIEDPELQNRERPVPGFESLISGAVTIDALLSDGEVLVLDENLDGMTDLTVIHTPGHSPGSISLFMEETGILFSGDALPVPGAAPVYDDPGASVESIGRLKEVEGVNALFQSWDEPREGLMAYARMDQGLACIQSVHSAVQAAAKEGLDDPDDVAAKTKAILGLPADTIGPLFTRTIEAHLKLLERESLIEEAEPE
ncbi:MAG: MBL fold metallo-hydrolase [Methanocalculus sp. MSAO_Arc1]|uniref:MBL fold metallo-hydrolase n=1 Tax=Methanocalculus TaxID=71151 RepID=UPI000FEFB35B|nr:MULTISPECIES: MBL fold metallo-hydrolase [unclassified Methanocalculus]MCP1662553.1 glyoxylase-like metal-dependent hydrolase (beta-lactamase superfamily II) [Methanocalculus sp. AMF5]RQD80075.1 MAG: MBL fold metallo-hydrolase [Methanocalculus sp. MSAO_Arc1]